MKEITDKWDVLWKCCGDHRSHLGKILHHTDKPPYESHSIQHSEVHVSNRVNHFLKPASNKRHNMLTNVLK